MTAAGVHSERARPALTRLASEDPALGALALWCAHRDATGGAAAQTDGTTIFYGPGFALLPLHEQVGLAAHHVLHVALRHGPRMGAMAARLGPGFDEALFGIAADALVNEVLLAAGYALPRPALTLGDLMRRALGQALSADALSDWDVERLFLALTGPGQGGGASGESRDPSGAGKAHQPKAGAAAANAAPASPAEHARQLAAEAGFAPDLVRASPDAETPKAAEEAADWRQHLARAMEAGRLAGRGLGLIGHRIADLAPPRTVWESVLRRLLMRALLSDPASSHARPARGWIAAEALARQRGTAVPGFLPGLRRSREVPRIVLAVDASGSVHGALLARFLTEVSGIARRGGAEVHLLAFDEAVRWQVRLDPAGWASQIAALDWPRGGGTDFASPLAAAQALGASVAVVLSDLDGPFGPVPRGLKVVWAHPSAAPPVPPPFGQCLALGH